MTTKNTLVNFGGFTVFSLIDRAFALFFIWLYIFILKKCIITLEMPRSKSLGE